MPLHYSQGCFCCRFVPSFALKPVGNVCVWATQYTTNMCEDDMTVVMHRAVQSGGQQGAYSHLLAAMIPCRYLRGSLGQLLWAPE